MKPGFIVPVREKLAYGVGDLAINIAYGAIGFYMLWFMVNVGGISAGLAGLIFMLARAWDAVSDYLMGRISDATRFRLGRRRPYILYGALPMGLSFAALWFVPDAGDALRFVYFLVVFVLFNTAFTVVAVPYGSLMAEMTSDYDERTSLSGFRMGSSFVGTLLGAAGVMVVVDTIFADLPYSQSYGFMGMIFGSVIVVILVVTALGTKERIQATSHQSEGFFQTIRSFFQLKEFRLVLGMFLFNMIGFDIIMASLFFFLDDVMQIRGDATIFMAAPLVVAVLVAPLWTWIGTRLGKNKAYIVAAGYFTLVMLLCLIIPVGANTFTLVVVLLAGVGVSASQIIPFSILPDIIEIDEHANGIRREGAFYGIMTFLYKAASGLAIAGTGFLLELCGYIKTSPDQSTQVAGIVQPQSALTAIRLLIALAPGVCFLVSAVFVKLLPLSRERFDRIRSELESRKG